MAGMLGHGDLFVLRDPAGIRPAFYYHDDEIVVVTSERPQIQTALDVPLDNIREIDPGHALIVKKDGLVLHEKINEGVKKLPCSFERIYFSRGTDQDIYKERKALGFSLVKRVLKSINYDIENTVFSYIPNTSETAFYGLIDGLYAYTSEQIKRAIENKESQSKINKLLSVRPRVEKLMYKDGKLRTFITADEDRTDLVAKVYDTTYGVIKPTDTLVVIDDSIVRGTTLKRSILRILDRLGMKKIIVVSTAPQIRFPDCYGIDMSKMGDFVAFEAAINLIHEKGKNELLNQVYQAAIDDEAKSAKDSVNEVKKIFEPLLTDEISEKITQIVTPENINAEVEILYQSIGGLHKACPNHKGDWYFTGDYPTSGGNRVANRSFINFMENNNKRAY